MNTSTLQSTILLKCNRPFPINTTVIRYKVVELFMSDVDGYADTVVSLPYASTAIQCWRNVNHQWVKFDTASTYPSLYHYKKLYFENGTYFSQYTGVFGYVVKWSSLCWIWMAVQRQLLFWHTLLKQISVEIMYLTIEWNVRQLVLMHHFTITNNYTFKMQQTFPSKYKSLWVCSIVELFMLDMDGCTEKVVILAYASKTIQCWSNIHNHWVEFETA